MVETYTEKEVQNAANHAADLIDAVFGNGHNEVADDIINLMVNATLTALKDPRATLDDVLAEGWGDVDEAREIFGID